MNHFGWQVLKQQHSSLYSLVLLTSHEYIWLPNLTTRLHRLPKMTLFLGLPSLHLAVSQLHSITYVRLSLLIRFYLSVYNGLGSIELLHMIVCMNQLGWGLLFCSGMHLLTYQCLRWIYRTQTHSMGFMLL